jgi:hypothetical protein
MKAGDVQKQLDAERLEHIAQLQAKDAQLQAKDAQHHTERLVGDTYIQIRCIYKICTRLTAALVILCYYTCNDCYYTCVDCLACLA